MHAYEQGVSTTVEAHVRPSIEGLQRVRRRYEEEGCSMTICRGSWGLIESRRGGMADDIEHCGLVRFQMHDLNAYKTYLLLLFDHALRRPATTAKG